MAFGKKNNVGFSLKEDFEKLFLGGLLAVLTLSVVWKYLRGYPTDAQIIYLIGMFLSAFVIRKGVSYFKADSYYANNSYQNGGYPNNGYPGPVVNGNTMNPMNPFNPMNNSGQQNAGGQSTTQVTVFGAKKPNSQGQETTQEPSQQIQPKSTDSYDSYGSQNK